MGYWMDIIGPEVETIAIDCQVQLTSSIVDLIDRVADVIERESRTNHLRHRRVKRSANELRSCFNAVSHEVYELRTNLLNGRLNDPRCFYVRRHPDTTLPIVHLTLRALPEIVVHVPREYATVGKGLTYGLAIKDYCGGPLTGRVAQAANYLRECCRHERWHLSVSDLLVAWVEAAQQIPHAERLKAQNAHAGVKRQLPPLPEGQWKARRVGGSAQPRGATRVPAGETEAQRKKLEKTTQADATRNGQGIPAGKDAAPAKAQAVTARQTTPKVQANSVQKENGTELINLVDDDDNNDSEVG